MIPAWFVPQPFLGFARPSQSPVATLSLQPFPPQSLGQDLRCTSAFLYLLPLFAYLDVSMPRSLGLLLPLRFLRL